MIFVVNLIDTFSEKAVDWRTVGLTREGTLTVVTGRGPGGSTVQGTDTLRGMSLARVLIHGRSTTRLQ